MGHGSVRSTGMIRRLKELPAEVRHQMAMTICERAQGITIDSARVFFTSAKRTYVIIDAPGHIEFLKNMVSGAARAEAAFLVIDAREGIQENTRRHGYLMGMLGIPFPAAVQSGDAGEAPAAASRFVIFQIP